MVLACLTENLLCVFIGLSTTEYLEMTNLFDEVKEIFEENTSLQKNLLGNEYRKIENYEKLYQEIVNEINKPYQYN